VLGLTEQHFEHLLFLVVLSQEHLHTFVGRLFSFWLAVLESLSLRLIQFFTPVLATCELNHFCLFDRHSLGRISLPVLLLAGGFGFSVLLGVEPLLHSELFNLLWGLFGLRLDLILKLAVI